MALKINLLALVGLLFTINGQAQDTIPLYSDALAKHKAARRPCLGLDLYQGVWFAYSALNNDSPKTYIYPVSATLYLPDKRLSHSGQAVYVNVGYVAYGGTVQRNIYQAGHSAHIRVGVEHTYPTLILGYGGLLSGWSGQGSFFFSGPTFGDYQETIGRRSGLAVGGEGHIGADIPLSNRLSMRPLVRGTILTRMGMVNNLRAPHMSGVDWQAENRTGMAVSFQVNLIIRL
ncbi:hypothetical protein [Fibrella aquatica]|uniref:hypothetical protein n=1 Tax=Fibrella aquatica TaxID=3242487 RepID=UPI003520B501